jgi:hypothetical protein
LLALPFPGRQAGVWTGPFFATIALEDEHTERDVRAGGTTLDNNGHMVEPSRRALMNEGVGAVLDDFLV